jgi:hypothetical protein
MLLLLAVAPLGGALRTAVSLLDGTGLLGHGHGDSGGGEAELFTDMLDALVVQDIVVPAPRELASNKAPGSEGLEEHEDLEVGDLLAVLMELLGEVLLDHDHAVVEKLGVNRSTVLLGNEHHSSYNRQVGKFSDHARMLWGPSSQRFRGHAS